MEIIFFDAVFPSGNKSINNRYIGLLLKTGADLMVAHFLWRSQ